MNAREELELARSLYQLTIYLESLHLPFTLQQLYSQTYGELWREMPGADWLDHLAEDEYVRTGLDESYTLKTVFETMNQSGLRLLLEVLDEETERLGIGMGVLRPGFYRRRPPQDE